MMNTPLSSRKPPWIKGARHKTIVTVTLLLLGPACQKQTSATEGLQKDAFIADGNDRDRTDVDVLILDYIAEAEALAALGDPEAAFSKIKGLPLEGPHATTLRRTSLWLALDTGNCNTALALLPTEYTLDAELNYLRGRSFHCVQRYPEAKKAFARALASEPHSRAALWSMRHLAEESGVYSTPAQAFLRHNIQVPTLSSRHMNALSIFQKLSDSAKRFPKVRTEALRAIASAAIDHEHFREAIDLLQQAKKICAEPQNCRSIFLHLGRAERHLGNTLTATRYLKKALGDKKVVAHQIPGDDSIAQQARSFMGDMYIQTREYELARQHFRAQLLNNPVGPQRATALWGLGFVAFRTGALKRAQRFFSTLVHEAPFSVLAPKALYWHARALGDRGEVDTARIMYHRITRQFPLDTYAYLAKRRLLDMEENGQAYTDSTTHAPMPAVVLERIDSLNRAGHYRRLRNALSEVDIAALSPTELNHLIAVAQSELVDATAQVARFRLQRSKRFPTPTDHDTLARLYPQTYRGLLQRAARKSRVDPSLLIALVRQESGFRPNAQSQSGAMGLMQLMPATADELWREGHRGHIAHDKLLDPVTNITLGSRYLGRMLRAFKGRAAYALSAYNAGPGAVTRWRQRFGDLPEDIFMEEIPYPETRNYVRRIFAGVQTLNYLGTGGAQTIAQRRAFAERPL